MGTTDDPSEIREAEKAAKRARGVTRVTNAVKVKEREMSPEELFHSQVRNDHEDKRR